jgi:DNA-binding XRE family transcriptional regulator
MAGLRERFAFNLRRLSAESKSYAEVARAIDVNRQQFNDYLTGKNLPNETIVRKICNYFEIDISDLFVDNSQNKFKHRKENNYIKYILNEFIDLSKNKCSMPDGIYNLYFEVPQYPEYILNSLLIVRTIESIITFKRITKIAKSSPLNPYRSITKHVGIVVSHENRIFLLGLDQRSDFAPSVLVCTPSVGGDTIYSGLAIVRSPSEYREVAFAIPRQQGINSLKNALKNIGFHSINSSILSKDSVSFVLRSARTFTRDIAII